MRGLFAICTCNCFQTLQATKKTTYNEAMPAINTVQTVTKRKLLRFSIEKAETKKPATKQSTRYIMISDMNGFINSPNADQIISQLREIVLCYIFTHPVSL